MNVALIMLILLPDYFVVWFVVVLEEDAARAVSLIKQQQLTVELVIQVSLPEVHFFSKQAG